MAARMKSITITAENIEQFQAVYGKAQIGDVYEIREPEKVDLRLFGQLRTWFGDPPKDDEP